MWNKIRQVEYRFLEHPIDRQSWNMRRGVEYSAIHGLTFLPAIRERQQVIFALTRNRREIHRNLHGWTRDAVDRQKLTVPHVARARRLRQTFELMAGVRRDGMRT